MKNILFAISVFAIMILMQCTAYCAEVNVNLGYTRLIDSHTIRIRGRILNPIENQSLIIMVANSEDGIYDDNSIIYFNQITPRLDSDNSFTIDLKTSENISDTEEYIIRIGGENVSVVEEKLLGYELSYGDVDGNYIITSNDAAMTLAYVLDKTSNPLTDIQIKKASVSGLKELSAADAACILNKAQNYSYIFPVE